MFLIFLLRLSIERGGGNKICIPEFLLNFFSELSISFALLCGEFTSTALLSTKIIYKNF